MNTFAFSFLLIALIHCVEYATCGVLIWGSESIQLPSLKQFNNEDFDLLKSYMRRPKVVIFRGDPMAISNELQELLKNKYTAYVPNSHLNLDGVIELNGDPTNNFKLIEDTLNNCSREFDNILAVIVSDQETFDRVKREAEEERVPTPTEITELVTEMENYVAATGPVLYHAKTKNNEVAMIYSSSTPVLKMNSTIYNLGKAAVETVDDREKYRQLSVTIPMEAGDKVTLRFKFLWNRGYWALNMIYLLDMYSKTYILLGKMDMSAAKGFSYHCTGNMVFEDPENEVELVIFDIQAQPDAKSIRFGDAYDCINFITVPIWSGIFVVFLLLLGLMVGLGALNSIKTMDKFDNKQLTISAEG